MGRSPPRTRAYSYGAGPLLMLKGYFDASGKGAKDVFVLAGCISTDDEWKDFSAAWQIELDGGPDRKRQPIRKFRLVNVSSEKRCAIFDKILRDHILARVAVVVDVASLMAVMQNSWWSKYIDWDLEPADTAYWYGFRVLNEVFHIERQRRPELKDLRGPIEFIFDKENRSDNAALVKAWGHLYSTASKEKRETVLGKRPSFATDDLVLPLQGADLVAGIARRLAASGKQVKGLPTPWRIKQEKPIYTITLEHWAKEIRLNLDRVMSNQFLRQIRRWPT